MTFNHSIDVSVTDPEGIVIDKSAVIKSKEEYIYEISRQLYHLNSGKEINIYSPVLKKREYKIKISSKNKKEDTKFEFREKGELVYSEKNIKVGGGQIKEYVVNIGKDVLVKEANK